MAWKSFRFCYRFWIKFLKFVSWNVYINGVIMLLATHNFQNNSPLSNIQPFIFHSSTFFRQELRPFFALHRPSIIKRRKEYTRNYLNYRRILASSFGEDVEKKSIDERSFQVYSVTLFTPVLSLLKNVNFFEGKFDFKRRTL